MKEPKTYSIITIKDIFEKIPSDKIELCLKELALVILQAKTIKSAYDATGEIFNFPCEIQWVDDDKGEIISNFRDAESDKFLGLFKISTK